MIELTELGRQIYKATTLEVRTKKTLQGIYWSCEGCPIAKSPTELQALLDMGLIKITKINR